MRSREAEAERGGGRRGQRRLPGSEFELRVLEGPDAGRTSPVTVRSSAVHVGSGPTASLRLTDAAVQPIHLSLSVEGSRLHLVDLSSPRSTRVNGVLAMEAFLLGGEVIRAGETLLQVRRVAHRIHPLPEATSFGRLLGESEAMRRLYPLLCNLAPERGAVLIEGERGTGKRLLAEELHRLSRRADAPFVRWDPPEGSGAADVDSAPFAEAAGGTLYIPELFALDLAGQRAIAERLERLAQGGERGDHARVIFGTRRCGTPSAIADELLVVLAPARIVLPPLRAREGDVLHLARAFWEELGGADAIPDDFVARFDRHSWPGNVRELRIAVESRIRDPEDLALPRAPRPGTPARAPDEVDEVIAQDLPMIEARNQVMARFERRYIERALDRSGRNVSRAAAASGIARRYFHTLRSRSTA